MRIHRISSETMTELGYSSKLNAEWDFLCMLRDEGRRSVDAFLTAHDADLGVRSTFDVGALRELSCSAFSLGSDCLSGCPSGAGACSSSRLPQPSSPQPLPASRFSRTGPRHSWAARRNFSPSSFRCFCSVPCSGSSWTTAAPSQSLPAS
jgi:hypothetical protein